MRERINGDSLIVDQISHVFPERKQEVIDACLIIVDMIATEFEGSDVWQLAQHTVNPSQIPEPSYALGRSNRRELTAWRKAREVLVRNNRRGDLYRRIDQRVKTVSAEVMLFEKIL